MYAASAAAAAGWPDPVLTIRPATAADRETIRPLHDQEFPATYAGLERLLPDEPDGKFHVLVAEEGSRFLGYAAGRVQPDGDGYLDYLAVPDAARGHGAGRDLLVAIGRYLVDAAPHHDVNLTVQDHRTPARRLYESLGFELQLSIVGYRAAEIGVVPCDSVVSRGRSNHGTARDYPGFGQAAQASGSARTGAPWASAPASMGWGRRKTPPMTAARAAITAPAAKATW